MTTGIYVSIGALRGAWVAKAAGPRGKDVLRGEADHHPGERARVRSGAVIAPERGSVPRVLGHARIVSSE